MNHDKQIVSLFDYSGEWSRPYREAGYSVLQVDVKLGTDVYSPLVELEDPYSASPGALRKVYGVLAAPPCTDFSGSGAQYWKAKDADGRTKASMALIERTVELIDLWNPTFWVLENPVGRLNTLFPWLVPYGPKYIQPWWYGDGYTKKTGLWGQFLMPIQTCFDKPDPVCPQGSWVQRLGGSSARTKELRSMTPPGFARAFFEANP